LHWRLLTSLPVDSLEDGYVVMGYYRVRWLIERFHYVLKSGCRVERLQLEKYERLERATITYSLVAWHLLWITLVARTVPDVACTVIFSQQQWQAVWAHHHRSLELPERVPTLSVMLGLVARLGGYLGRKHDGPPGPQSVWRGLKRMADITDTWCLLRSPLQPSTPA